LAECDFARRENRLRDLELRRPRNVLVPGKNSLRGKTNFGCPHKPFKSAQPLAPKFSVYENRKSFF
jgi:hypothetical protein